MKTCLVIILLFVNESFVWFQTSLYPYVCKYMSYPVGHPECLIGPKLNGYNMDNLEGLSVALY